MAAEHDGRNAPKPQKQVELQLRVTMRAALVEVEAERDCTLGVPLPRVLCLLQEHRVLFLVRPHQNLHPHHITREDASHIRVHT